jgi:peptidoglycan/LPS O-acetylase OafA/YrhL
VRYSAAMTREPDLKLNNFDLLRIAAALQVVLVHGLVHLKIARPAWWPIVEAFPGVPIFFAISGFLISAAFERSSSLASYTRNRLLRILPGLWCCALITTVVAAAFGFRMLQPAVLAWLPAQFAGLIYTPQFLKSFGFGSYNGSLWTIPIELQFYAALPVLYWLGGARAAQRARFLAACAVVFTIVGLLFALSTAPLAEGQAEPALRKLFRYSFGPHIYLFLAGVLLQRWQLQGSRWIAGKGLYWLATYLLFHFALPYNALTYIAGTLLMAVATVSLAYTAPALAQRLLRGQDISYGAYIYHGLLINVLLQLGYVGQPLLMPILVALTCAAAYASWRLVERPFLGRKRQSIHPAGLSPLLTPTADAVPRLKD